MNDPGTIIRFICAALTPWEQGNDRERLREQIRSGSVPWERVVEIASKHFVITSLWSGFFDKGLAELLPEDLIEALEELHRLNSLRNDSITRQVREIIECLNAIGLEPLLLKGSAYLATGTFPDAGARFMWDIDVMVPQEVSEEAVKALTYHGYRMLHADHPAFELSPHLPPLEHPSGIAQVELHTSLASQVEPQVLKVPQAWETSQVLRAKDLTFRVLSPAHTVLYNLLHTEIRHLGYGCGILPLRGLYDFAHQFFRAGGHLDWSTMESAMAGQGIHRVLRSYLFMARRLFSAPVPLNLVRGSSSHLHLDRCVAQMRNPLFMIIGRTWGLLQSHYSSHRIRQTFAPDDTLAGVARGRVRYTGYLFRKYLRAAPWRVLRRRIRDIESR